MPRFEGAMDWWIWVLGGLVLLLGEVLTPGGFFVVFFGAGALLGGARKPLGVGGGMGWWIWVLGGLVLLLGEVLTPGGFFVVFFGAGAILVGALKLLGWGG